MTRRGRRVGLPLPALLLAGIAISFFALPLVGLLWRAPWSSAWSYLTGDTALTALRLSLVTSLCADEFLSACIARPPVWH